MTTLRITRAPTASGRKPTLKVAQVWRLRELRGKRRPPTVASVSRELGIHPKYGSAIASGRAYRWVR